MNQNIFIGTTHFCKWAIIRDFLRYLSLFLNGTLVVICVRKIKLDCGKSGIFVPIKKFKKVNQIYCACFL